MMTSPIPPPTNATDRPNMRRLPLPFVEFRLEICPATDMQSKDRV
jgi:hypothetical protein